MTHDPNFSGFNRKDANPVNSRFVVKTTVVFRALPGDK